MNTPLSPKDAEIEVLRNHIERLQHQQLELLDTINKLEKKIYHYKHIVELSTSTLKLVK